MQRIRCNGKYAKNKLGSLLYEQITPPLMGEHSVPLTGFVCLKSQAVSAFSWMVEVSNAKPPNVVFPAMEPTFEPIFSTQPLRNEEITGQCNPTGLAILGIVEDSNDCLRNCVCAGNIRTTKFGFGYTKSVSVRAPKAKK